LWVRPGAYPGVEHLSYLAMLFPPSPNCYLFCNYYFEIGKMTSSQNVWAPIKKLSSLKDLWLLFQPSLIFVIKGGSERCSMQRASLRNIRLRQLSHCFLLSFMIIENHIIKFVPRTVLCSRASTGACITKRFTAVINSLTL